MILIANERWFYTITFNICLFLLLALFRLFSVFLLPLFVVVVLVVVLVLALLSIPSKAKKTQLVDHWLPVTRSPQFPQTDIFSHFVDRIDFIHMRYGKRKWYWCEHRNQTWWDLNYNYLLRRKDMTYHIDIENIFGKLKSIWNWKLSNANCFLAIDRKSVCGTVRRIECGLGCDSDNFRCCFPIRICSI